jgi:hypothetical protein
MTEMIPDGWIELTLKKYPWDDLAEDAPKPYKLRILFMDMKKWSEREHGLWIWHPTCCSQEVMMIPWHNIICLEVKQNSPEYVAWMKRHNMEPSPTDTTWLGVERG